MKQFYKHLVGLMAAACLAGTLAAQAPEGITNEAQYDAWKLQFVTGELPPPTPQVALKSGSRDLDGPCACWIEPDDTYVLALSPNDDGSSTVITLPFQFNLYGDQYNTCYVNNNGNVSFVNPYGTYSSAAFPNPNFKMVAPFWADVDTRNGDGTVKYKLTSNALYVNWTDVGYFSQQTDKLNSFQLIISDGTDPAIPGGNNVSFCYGNMEWTTGSASGGTEGFGGTPATVGANRGDGLNYLQFGRFDQPGEAYNGPFGPAGGVAWLNDRHFVFSTENETIPPIFATTECDTTEIEIGSSFDYPMLILPGGPGQTVLATAESPTLSNFTITTTQDNNAMNLVLSMHPQPEDLGSHVITVTAQVEGSPTLVSTYTFYVKVMATTGIQELGGGALSLVPNPSNGLSTLHWPTGQAPQRVEVMTVEGKVIKARMPQAGSNHLEIDLSGRPQGVYVVRTVGAAGTQTLRLLNTSSR